MWTLKINTLMKLRPGIQKDEETLGKAIKLNCKSKVPQNNNKIMFKNLFPSLCNY